MVLQTSQLEIQNFEVSNTGLNHWQIRPGGSPKSYKGIFRNILLYCRKQGSYICNANDEPE